MKKIILAGNAIAANILYNYLLKDKRYQVMGLVVDDDFVGHAGIENVNSIGFSQVQDKFNPLNYAVIMAMGYGGINFHRESMYHRLKKIGYQIETYVHPDAKVYTDIPLGEGCVILPSAVIEPHVHIGSNCMIWANVTLAHHSIIAENCWIASGAVISGQAKVGCNVFIGVNATIVNDIEVGAFSLIGAGALITKNTKASSVHLARSGEELRYSSQDYVKFFGV